MRTLYAKLSVALLLLLLLLGAVAGALTVRTSRLYMYEVQQNLHRGLAMKVLQDQPAISDASVREATLDEIFEKLMIINPDIEVYLLDDAGGILGYSAPPGRVQRDSVDLAPVRAFLAEDARLPVLGTDPRNPGVDNIFSVAPIGGPSDGYLYIVLASEQLDSVATMVATSYILRTGVVLFGVSLLATLAAGLLLFRRLTARLRNLTEKLGAFEAEMLRNRAGEQAAESILRGQIPGDADEIDSLERGFHDMSRRIGRQLSELEEQDQERRELLANISHDVRTPLTHLQGYLETMLMKGDELSDEDRREYLQIAVQRSEQLGRLVADLLDLAKLDAPETLMQKEEFSVAELVQDVTQDFKLAAEKRGVELQVHIDAASARIIGNLGTLERALQNLIENAVRYTNSGDRVDVSVEYRGGEVNVAVRDTGPGIPPNELEYVFDRFYRCRARTDGSQEGSGLGLSIAQRALELHGADLACESQVGEGTTFRFALACVPEPA